MPIAFMQLINEVLNVHLYKGVLVYLDDILIYSKIAAELLGLCQLLPAVHPLFTQIDLSITKLLKTEGGDEAQIKPAAQLDNEGQLAFEKLKWLYAVEPTLKHPNPVQLFIIQANTNDVAVEVVYSIGMLRKSSNPAPTPPGS